MPAFNIKYRPFRVFGQDQHDHCFELDMLEWSPCLQLCPLLAEPLPGQVPQLMTQLLQLPGGTRDVHGFAGSSSVLSFCHSSRMPPFIWMHRLTTLHLYMNQATVGAHFGGPCFGSTNRLPKEVSDGRLHDGQRTTMSRKNIATTI